MSGDTLTYDMAMMPEGAPQIFVKRDMLTLQDQQNGNYAGNQLTIDTSQLANSNKYMDYRNAYLSVPLIMAATSPTDPSGCSMLSYRKYTTPVDSEGKEGEPVLDLSGVMKPGYDQFFSLKNWFGNICHSMILDYAGTTIIQQTSLTGLWSTFRLMTTLSMADVITLGPTIGFYPDSSNFRFSKDASAAGIGLCNNSKNIAQGASHNGVESFGVGGSEVENPGMWERWSKLMINADASSGQGGSTFKSLQDTSQMDQVYRTRVLGYSTQGTGGYVQEKGQVAVTFQIMAYIYLRHLHPFFSQIPLLKGVFFRLTLNLNQAVVEVEQTDAKSSNALMNIKNIISPLGGIVPVMISSSAPWVSSINMEPVSAFGPLWTQAEYGKNNTSSEYTMRVTMNVGATVIDTTQQQNLKTSAIEGQTGSLGNSVFLNVPAYTFNPSFETAYLSKPTKTIVYSDLYQFTTAINTSGQFQYLVSNGISNIKSVLIIPFAPKIADAINYPPFWSPFDTAGGGTTAALASLTNFNVVVAGQNMIYNSVQRSYEEFMDNLYGCNAVNAGLTDGMTSSLINFWDFQQMYGYYYVNCARQLPIDEAVPKSIQIQGTNNTKQALQFYVFVEYGVQVNVDVLTGARV